MARSSKLRFFQILGIFLIFEISLAAVNANPTVRSTGKACHDNNGQLAQRGKTVRQKTDKEILTEMCVFLGLDEQQTDQVVKLFDNRLKEIKEIFDSVRSGKLGQQESLEKNAESYRKHREMLLNLLNEKQKAKLKIWEEQQLSKTSRG